MNAPELEPVFQAFDMMLVFVVKQLTKSGQIGTEELSSETFESLINLVLAV